MVERRLRGFGGGVQGVTRCYGLTSFPARAGLIGKGIDRKRLDELHAPAGLDLGAATPEEIAISILGEIITVRRRNKKQADAGQSVTSPAAE